MRHFSDLCVALDASHKTNAKIAALRWRRDKPAAEADSLATKSLAGASVPLWNVFKPL